MISRTMSIGKDKQCAALSEVTIPIFSTNTINTGKQRTPRNTHQSKLLQSLVFFGCVEVKYVQIALILLLFMKSNKRLNVI